MRFKQWGAALQDLGQLHLLDENDPHVRIAGVVFWEGNIDWDHVLVFVVTRYPSAFLFLYCVDAGFPSVDEVDWVASAFLNQDPIAKAHGACADYCIFCHHMYFPSFIGCLWK